MNFSTIFCLIVVLFTIICTKAQVKAQNCRSTGVFRADAPPAGKCSTDCCIQNQVYFTFQCSPTVTNQTPGILTVRSFQKNGAVRLLKCDSQYHSDTTPVVALSTGWYSNGSRCGKTVLISANGKSVKAKVVDECDSTKGCGAEEGYHPPCSYNVVSASKSVWFALGVPVSQSGQLSITWSDV